MEKYKFKLVKIFDETSDTKTFRFEPVNEKLDFIPGQFVFLYVNINGEEIKRPYSIATSPLDPDLELTIELVNNGTVTDYMHDKAKVGDILELSDPQGRFTYTEDLSKNIVVIAGGCGIVPMRSIMRYCTQKKLDTKITFFYSCKRFSSIIYREELNQLQIDNPNLKIIYTLTQEDKKDWEGLTGRFKIDMLLDNFEDPTNNVYFLCGPMPMVKALSDGLKQAGISSKNIKRELWGNP